MLVHKYGGVARLNMLFGVSAKKPMTTGIADLTAYLGRAVICVRSLGAASYCRQRSI